jgi:hypothetical protein
LILFGRMSSPLMLFIYPANGLPSGKRKRAARN